MIPKISIRAENQENDVGEEIAALIAIVRPILQGLLFGLKKQIVDQQGGHSKITLQLLARLYRPGDGDVGICFEYAVHDAIKRNEFGVIERISDSMTKFCKIKGKETESILFGAEKSGALRLIDTARSLLTEDSRLLTGERAQPVKLKSYINLLSGAFRRPSTRAYLPASISGAWKADLFVGMRDTDRWVATTVKVNPNQLEGARGLRIGIVPTSQGKSDKIKFDDLKNLVICPLPYDAAFMELFYSAWIIVQQFIKADAEVPQEVALPNVAHRKVASILSERRRFSVIDVIDVLKPLAQPELLQTHPRTRNAEPTRDDQPLVDTLIAPVSRKI